mgnify:CR=1 FL=1
MEDDHGVKTNILQSELNDLMQEQNEKWIEEAYFKSHPVIPEKKESTYDMIRKRFLENREIAPEFPKKAPPKMVNGFHPEYGKRADRYKKLDSLVLYACTSGYPVPPKDICLLEINYIINKYKKHVKEYGFSGHHNGIAPDIAALTLGLIQNRIFDIKSKTILIFILCSSFKVC